MGAREDLARTIGTGLDGWKDFDAASVDWRDEMLSAADAVIAAGWRPPERVGGGESATDPLDNCPIARGED